jgi:hypothetical protein
MAAAGAGRPWWASDEGSGRLADDDPLTAHRRARAGAGPAAGPAGGPDGGPDGEPGEAAGPDADGPDVAAAWWSEAGELLFRAVREVGRAATGYADHVRDQAVRSAGGDGATDDGPGHVHAAPGEVCHLCPVCAGLRAFDEARPEVVAHLGEAARHITLAARALLDAQAEALRRPEGLERIDLDEE